MVPSRVNREPADTLIQWMMTQSVFLPLAREKEKAHQFHPTVVSRAVETIFHGDCTSHVTPRRGNDKKGTQNKSWSKSASQGKDKEGKKKVNPKDDPKVPRVPKLRTKVRVRKLVCQVLKTRNHRHVRNHSKLHKTYSTDNYYTDNSWFDDG